MAGKNPKPKKPVKRLHYRNLKPSEVLCPVCRTILVEPVTLPCDHAFCRECFEDTMDNVNLGCPLCRNRVSSWVRTAKKAGTFINKEFWTAIQRQYPQALKNKYNGIENDFEKETPVIIVASPGDIRKEYEKERKKHLEEQNKFKVEEEKASAALIEKLNEEEAYQHKVKKEKIRRDELLAQKLQEELDTPSTSRRPRLVKTEKAGPMDRFIKSEKTTSLSKKYSPKQKPKKLFVEDRKQMCISSGDNSDIIDQECRFYFKPIDLHKKYHKPGKVPVKVTAVRASVRCISDRNPLIRTPTREITKMGYGQTAFAWFVAGLRRGPETEEDTQKVPAGKELPSTSENGAVKIPKRKSSSFDNTKLPKKRARLLNSAKRRDNLRSKSKPWAAPVPSCQTFINRATPLNLAGFETFEIKESENYFNNFISKCDKLAVANIQREASLDIKKGKLQHKNYSIDINRNIPKSTNVSLNTSAIDSINGEINGLSPESPVINNFIGKKIIQFNKPSENPIIFDTPPGDFDSSDSEEDVVLSNLIDSICKTKLDNCSPTSLKKAKKSPKKAEAGTSKPFNGVDIDLKIEDLDREALPSPESCLSNANREEMERKRQEKEDLALAKKLQAEFDWIHVVSTTRRGTKRRQATLDEMLTV